MSIKGRLASMDMRIFIRWSGSANKQIKSPKTEVALERVNNFVLNVTLV